MKFRPDKNQITWSITGIVTALVVMLIYYVIFKGGYIISGLHSIVDGMEGVVTGLALGYILSPILNFVEQKILEKIWEKAGAKRDENGEFRHKQLIRNIAIIITMAFVIFIIWACMYYIIPQIYQSIRDIIRNIPTYYRNIDLAINRFLESSDPTTISTVNGIADQIYVRINSYVQETVLPNISQILTMISKQAINVINSFINLIVGLIVAIYVLNSKESFCGKGKKMAYAFFREDIANEVISSSRLIHTTFTGFITGKIVDSAIIGLLCFIGCRIMDIPYYLLISVIVGIANIIPFFGPYIGGGFGFLILILISPLSALEFIVFVIILQQIDGNIIGPKILGNSTGLSSFWVIFAIMLFGSLWGFAGWILGVPVFAVIYSLISRVTDHYLDKNHLPTDEETYIDTAYIEEGKFHYLGDPNSTKYRSQKAGSSWSRIFRSKHKEEHKKSHKSKNPDVIKVQESGSVSQNTENKNTQGSDIKKDQE
ncbi:MAG: AI-2E family transporter [Butyrivibrio sp.]|uniref:AI-2E family transporter n=1 Tax=Butyrivibrio sp. TaxID=28121 RepID=UPI0025D41677|nr:AI-2E family transporter [Butyrivibrio sp.]MCR5771028.1 AI-2E family transporter [Butyrivibrio sp.]